MLSSPMVPVLHLVWKATHRQIVAEDSRVSYVCPEYCEQSGSLLHTEYLGCETQLWRLVSSILVID